MSVTVSEDGSVQSVTVLDGPEELRQASVDAVFTWVYSPALRKGKAVEMNIVVTVAFNLNRG